jgi:hypothetical protein
MPLKVNIAGVSSASRFKTVRTAGWYKEKSNAFCNALVLLYCADFPTPAKYIHTCKNLRDCNNDYFAPSETACWSSAKFRLLL